MVNLYGRFLPKCADTILHLTSLLSGSKCTFERTPAALTSFEHVKALLTDVTLLTHFHADSPISLMVDAYNVAVGAVLPDSIVLWLSSPGNYPRPKRAAAHLDVNFSPLILPADKTTLCNEKGQILQRSAGLFRGVLNRPSTITDAAIARLPQVEINANLDLPPSVLETIRVVQQQLSSEIAPGSDAIPPAIHNPPTHGSSDGALLGDVASGISPAVFQEYYSRALS
nr:unnamed protein product [Spirometra erinaceieuropaei]